jgi:hypothetical protein
MTGQARYAPGAGGPAGRRPGELALFIDPASHHFEGDRLFELSTSGLGGAHVLAPYLHLRDWMGRRGIAVHTADLLERGEAIAERNVYMSLGIRHRYPRLVERDDVIPSAFFALECPIVEPKLYRDLHAASRAFRRTFSYSSAEALRPFLTGPVAVQPFRIPQSFDAVHERIWADEDRGFLTIINANKLPRLQVGELYTERLRAVAFFGRHDEIDLYGIGWDGPPYRLGHTRVPATLRRGSRAIQSAAHRVKTPELLAAARRAYRGPVDDKARALGRYRFAICFENMLLEGWITEKLFDCLFSGTIPIYLGATDVERFVPRECFIDMRDFAGYPELREYLHALGPAEVSAYREAARAFIASEGFRPFSMDAFAELFGRLVEEDADVGLAAMAA